MFVKLIAGLFLVASLAFSGVPSTDSYRATVPDCCAVGGECCYPGSPCCADDCCAVGADCCNPPSACCAAAKSQTKAADCCTGGDCCNPPRECCLTGASK